MDTIKLGTRGSKLALWQAEYIRETLGRGGMSVEIRSEERRVGKEC